MSTAKHEIAVERRAEFGKNASRRARHAGMVPANLYGKGVTPSALLVNAGDWESLSSKDLSLVYLVEGKTSTAALVKEVQYNHLKGQTTHIDFQAVNLNEEVHTEIHIHLHGAAACENQGGVLTQELHMLQVACKPQEIPDGGVVVEVSHLAIGETLHVRDLTLPAGVRALSDADAIVCSVAKPTEEEVAAAPAEGAEPEVLTEKKDKAKDAE